MSEVRRLAMTSASFSFIMRHCKTANFAVYFAAIPTIATVCHRRCRVCCRTMCIWCYAISDVTADALFSPAPFTSQRLLLSCVSCKIGARTEGPWWSVCPSACRVSKTLQKLTWDSLSCVRTALRPTQPLIERLPGLFPGLKRPGFGVYTHPI